MKPSAKHQTTRRLVVLLFAVLGGCVTAGGYDAGYGYDDATVGYGVGFYEPHGYDYGRWRPGYRVGPPRHFDGDHGPRPISAPHPTYRPAPQSRPMPSIPTRGRGGFHGGDGGHR